MSPLLEQARELLSAARRDQKTLRVLVKDPESPLESELFHAQQAIEKAIKTALVCANVIFRRTHDLLALSELADTHGIAIPLPHDLLLRLGPYAVEFRYLSVRVPEVDIDEARIGVDTAIDWAESLIREIE